MNGDERERTTESVNYCSCFFSPVICSLFFHSSVATCSSFAKALHSVILQSLKYFPVTSFSSSATAQYTEVWAPAFVVLKKKKLTIQRIGRKIHILAMRKCLTISVSTTYLIRHIENSNNNWHVITAICIDKHKLLSDFPDKLHFVSSVVKWR